MKRNTCLIPILQQTVESKYTYTFLCIFYCMVKLTFKKVLSVQRLKCIDVQRMKIPVSLFDL